MLWELVQAHRARSCFSGGNRHRCDLKQRLAVVAIRWFRSDAESNEEARGGRRLSGPEAAIRPPPACRLGQPVAPVGLQDGRDPNFRDGLLGFVFDVLACAELSLDLEVIALLESGGEGSQPTQHNGAMPFSSRGPFAVARSFQEFLGREREDGKVRIVLGRSSVGITTEESG